MYIENLYTFAYIHAIYTCRYRHTNLHTIQLYTYAYKYIYSHMYTYIQIYTYTYYIKYIHIYKKIRVIGYEDNVPYICITRCSCVNEWFNECFNISFRMHGLSTHNLPFSAPYLCRERAALFRQESFLLQRRHVKHCEGASAYVRSSLRCSPRDCRWCLTAAITQATREKLGDFSGIYVCQGNVLCSTVMLMNGP